MMIDHHLYHILVIEFSHDIGYDFDVIFHGRHITHNVYFDSNKAWT
jgi:hypothetical protein